MDDWLEDEDLVAFYLFSILHFSHLFAQQGSILFIFLNLFNLFFYRQGSFDDEVKDIVELPTEDAYRMAMKSMLRWVKKNMDRKKTRVFFTGMSPSHAK